MEIRRIVPNIPSNKMDESKIFYRDFIGLQLMMDMEWVLTFGSTSNSLAQITIVKNDNPQIISEGISVSIEVNDIEKMYSQAQQLHYEITYPITNEPWGVRRFFVKDPNGVIINIMTHVKN